jgi:hypothetical protein
MKIVSQMCNTYTRSLLRAKYENKVIQKRRRSMNATPIRPSNTYRTIVNECSRTTNKTGHNTRQGTDGVSTLIIHERNDRNRHGNYRKRLINYYNMK